MAKAAKKTTTKKATKRTPKAKAPVQETVENTEKGALISFRSNGL